MSRPKISPALAWLFFGFLTSLAVLPQPSAAAQDDPRIAWLKNNAITLRSIDPADDDFSDLEPLRRAIGNARIVQLGEQSHQDGATFHAKARLIKFLHQKMGFDVLAMESGLYDCRKAWELLRGGKEPFAAVQHGVFGIWTGSEQFQPVVDYLGTCVKSERPLELCGFDCQPTGAASHENLPGDLKSVMAQIDEAELSAAARATVIQTIEELARFTKPPAEAAVENQRREALMSLGKALAAQKPSDNLPAKELAFWRQYILSLASEIEHQLIARSGQSIENAKKGGSLRDAQMAKNLLWLAREMYPERKIIVWAASFHLMRNPFAVEPQAGGMPADIYRDTVTMGDEVFKTVGKETYTLAFLAADGEAARPGQKPFKLAPIGRGSLEDLCVSAGLKNAIIDFRQLDQQGAWLGEKLAARILGYSYSQANWTDVFDGIVFTRTMYPSTLTTRMAAAQRAAAGAAPMRAAVAQGWTGPPKESSDFEAGLDQAVKRGGNASAYLKAVGDKTPRGFGSLGQTFSAEEYRGKRLRMSAFVKSEGVEGAAGLWMRIDGKESMGVAFDNMGTRPIKGTSDWTRHEVVLDLPEDAATIAFGLLLSGKGQVWIDDFSFEPVGQDVATTAMPALVTKRLNPVAANLRKVPRNLDFEQ